MAWIDALLDRLAAELPCGYRVGGYAATEPTALAALALIGHGRLSAAKSSLEWLAELQAGDGSLGISAEHATPHWPTSLGMLAWMLSGLPTFRPAAQRGAEFLLSFGGKPLERGDEMGHDTTLIGWPWVESTHSWMEPTALAVLAFKAVGRSQHPRTREAVRLIVDRLLETGGCNYGNTMVLGQKLRPHLQPTGIALLALRGVPDADGRMSKSLDYLAEELNETTAAASLAWGLMGLAAHGRPHNEAVSFLETAWRREQTRGTSPHKMALIALAALGTNCPLANLTATSPHPGPLPAGEGAGSASTIAREV